MGLKEVIFGTPAVRTQSAQYAGSSQEWIPVADIQQGIVITKDGRFVKILEILPVNFELKSAAEQKNIIVNFTAYLKVAPNSLQILVITKRADADAYEAMMRRHLETESEENCRELIEDNIREVRYLTTEESITHRFYLVISLEPHMKLRENSLPGIADRLAEEERTARRYLEVCGLEIAAPDYADNQQLSILYDLLNPRTSRRAKLPLSIFEMVSPVYGLWEEELDRRLEEEMENEDFEEPPPESAAPAQEAGNGKDEGGAAHKARTKAKRVKKKKKGRKEKTAELSPLEEGAYTIPDILAPSSVDFTGRDYIVVDGIYHTTLYITGYGYKTAVHRSRSQENLDSRY